MEKIIMHIDVNNAFLSWTALELLDNGYPVDIRDTYAVIGGDEKRRAGIVLAKSTPCKKLGIKTAETIYSAKRKCPNLRIFPPNYKMYRKRSKELFSLLLKYTPDIEIASIDECYLDYGKVKKLYGDELLFAKKIRKEVNDKLGFTINIGIANNKLCAKMASDFEKPNMIHTLYEYEIEKKMFPLEIEDLFTVGKNTSEKLRNLGIKTIGDLAHKKETDLRRIFKNQASYLIRIANGIDDSEVDSSEFRPKGISNEITLGKDVYTKKELYSFLKEISLKVSKRIRDEGKSAKVICVILKDSSFRRYSHQKKLKNAISSFDDVYKYAKEVLNEFYNGEKIRLVGIRLDDFILESSYQTSLFDNLNSKEGNKIDKVVDKINSKYGKNVLKRASFVEKK